MHWSFNLASWVYFGIASLLVLALAVGPRLLDRAVSAEMIVVGAFCALVLASLGVWSKRVYLAASRPTKFFYGATLMAFILLGAFSSSYVGFVIFGLPSILVAVGMREVEVAKRRSSIAEKHDG
jgi:multisubunit Na+/H+ antiporter MnhF subunit